MPGLIGYEDGVPVAWVSLGPREDYVRLQRSPIMKPVDDRPVWSIVCFFVAREARGRGISRRMLRAAVDYAKSRGARLLEAYPVDKAGPSDPDAMFFGAKSMYDRAGFKEVARRRPTRPVVGNDYIDPGSWPDTVFAGPGDDFLAAQDLGGDKLAGGTGFDRALVDPDDSLSGIEWTSPPN